MSTKIRSRRFCLLLSYSGKKYLGMQRNPGANTIEEQLLKALKTTGLISEENFIRPQSMYFQRAARTDKSVSAIRQIVSLKVLESISTQIDDLNNNLPDDIRLMACRRVTQSFDAKNYCDGRTYSYLMPSFALCPLTEIATKSYRVTDEIIKQFNETLQGYVGSHVFHNFTSGKSFKDDSSVRVIRYMNCSEPFFPCDQDELEFVVVRVKGQSFMMHQIRKMIGLAIAIIKGFATEDHLKRSMEQPFMDVPKAPGLGLMLEEVHFDKYNRKFGGDGHHEPLEWNEVADKIDDFKNKYIYSEIVETELKEQSMMNWLHTLTLHSYGNDKVRTPELQALIKSGKLDKCDSNNVCRDDDDDARPEGVEKKIKLMDENPVQESESESKSK